MTAGTPGQAAATTLPVVVALLMAAAPSVCSGQVYVGIEAWSVSTGRASSDFQFADSPGVRVNLRPKFTGGPGALRISVGGAGLRASGYFGSATAELESRAGDFRITSDVGALSVILGGLNASLPLADIGTRARVRVSAGPFIERWSDALLARTRVGADAGISLELRLGHRFLMTIDRAIAASSSPLVLADVSGTGATGFAPRTLLQSVTRWGLSFKL